MPLYEYKCAKCGSVFEVMQKFADQPLQVHHDCGGAVERLLSAPSLRFKGTGWYITDYGNKHVSPGNGHGERKSEKTESKSDSSESDSSTAASKPTPAPAEKK